MEVGGEGGVDLGFLGEGEGRREGGWREEGGGEEGNRWEEKHQYMMRTWDEH